MQSLVSFFQKSKPDPCDDETILKCANVIVMKILERLGKCKTEAELDALLSLLGKSFIEKYDEFTDEFGGKPKSFENIIFKLKSKEGKPFETYVQKLKQPICDAFEEQFDLTESTFVDIFEDEKWNDAMFEYMVGNTFGCISIYFVILACLKDPHADRRTDLREQITYQLADIAWFIRDTHDPELRRLCLLNPWYRTKFPEFFDPTCIHQQDRLDALGAPYHIPSPLVDTEPFRKKFDTVDGDERRIQRLIALNKLFEKIPIFVGHFVGQFNFVDILIRFLIIKKGLTQKTYVLLSKSVAIDHLQLIHNTLKRYMPNFVKTTHIKDIVIREVEGSDGSLIKSKKGGRRRKTRTLKSHHRPNKTNKAKPRRG